MTTIVDNILWRLKKIENNIIIYCASVLLPQEELHTFDARAVGLIGHLIMGATFGIVVGQAIIFSGNTSPYLIGMGVGAIYWLILHQSLTAKFWV
ncbi:hypothetical protein [Sporotomaculum syntrophicum]|uniref:hypothetical protein n=1 Tax=Sporotomaculum syntrophicum TaxID=182264 RepID=UPI0013798F9F|nr:hypothetical protein [Sporotomaculum syntrophicum]